MTSKREIKVLTERYPRPILLKDGREVILRLMTREDKKPLIEFFQRIPLEDRRHLAEDVADPKVIGHWVRHLNYRRVLPLLADYQGRIVADATLRRFDKHWIKHVGAIRIVVDPEFRRQHLCQVMVRELIYQALRSGLDKVKAEFPTQKQDFLEKMLGDMGFQREAILKHQVKALDGSLDHMVIMTNDVEALWQNMADLYQEFTVFREF